MDMTDAPHELDKMTREAFDLVVGPPVGPLKSPLDTTRWAHELDKRTPEEVLREIDAAMSVAAIEPPLHHAWVLCSQNTKPIEFCRQLREMLKAIEDAGGLEI